MNALQALETKLLKDLELSHISTEPSHPPKDCLDIAIIGAGQLGLGLCFALSKRNMHNVHIFDQAPAGYEGPWATTARMLTLRTEKDAPDPSLGFPSLSFRAWHEATRDSWDALDKIPTLLWAEYLRWYGKVLQLPVSNQQRLCAIKPKNKEFELQFDKMHIRAKKIVLATGRAGCGGWKIPSFVEGLPKSVWYHTAETINPAIFQKKRIAVVGCAASAFDIAAVALENGAEMVYMLMRRTAIPQKNLLAEFACWSAFASIPEKERIALIATARKMGTCPPTESIERALKWQNFKILANTHVEKISYHNALHIQTNNGVVNADLLMLGTGYKVDLSAVEELSDFSEEILRWGDRHSDMPSNLAPYPYLGPHFEFIERHPGKAPFLENIHCFNNGALLSQGRIAGDIDQMAIGIERLAEGLAIDLFLRDADLPKKISLL